MSELRPCYHECEERDYIVCDRCLRKWNTRQAALLKLVNRLAEKLRLIRHYDAGSHSPETVEDIIAEAGREIA